jgi:putative DNA modification/repair radical SAM protein
MEDLVRVARSLREEHDFRGYIHLKTIPDADPEWLRQAGLYADRLSINIELPSEPALRRLAPEKSVPGIRRSMGRLKEHIASAHAERKAHRKAPVFSPAGQSTQMIIGADASNDLDILRTSVGLYSNYDLKRVYYSAFSPIPDASSTLPLAAPPLLREHRLYQADWMLRFYGFRVEDLAAAAPAGMLDPEIDPKLAWALAHRALFPVDVNRAPREMLLRVPGLGPRGVDRILAARRFQSLTLEDVRRFAGAAKRALPFITARGWTPGATLDSQKLRASFTPPPRQMELFAS